MLGILLKMLDLISMIFDLAILHPKGENFYGIKYEQKIESMHALIKEIRKDIKQINGELVSTFNKLNKK